MVPVVSCANADGVQPPARNSTATSAASRPLTGIVLLLVLVLRLLRLLSVGFFRLLIALGLNQMLAHKVGCASRLAIANRLVDMPVRIRDRPQIAPPVGR